MAKPLHLRHKTRVLLLQKLFERYVKNKSIQVFDQSDIDFQSLLQINGFQDYAKELYEKLSSCVSKNLATIDSKIQVYSTERNIDTLPLIDICILRIAVCEKYFARTAEDKVIINEAIELAKEFGGIEDGAFVNAILDNMFKKEAKV